MLLDKFKFDINQEGSVKLEGFIIKGVSALWCATGKIENILKINQIFFKIK